MRAGTKEAGTARCLLVVPPVDLPTHPYPAVVQLATWLRRRGHAVEAVDANVRFFRWAIGAERLERGCGAARELLARLDAGDLSPDSETRPLLAEYRRSLGLRERFPGLFESLMDEGSPLPVPFRLDAVEAALNLAFAPTFPERVMTRVSLQYRGRADRFSSASLWEALESRSLLDEFYADLLPALPLDDFDFVGISVPFPQQFEPCLRLCRAIRRSHPRLPLYLGGPAVGIHLQLFPDERIFRLVDGMVVGDGEKPLEAMLAASRRGGVRPEEVPGMVWLDGGEIRRNPLPPPTPLSGVSAPDDVFSREGYLCAPGDPFHRLSLSRGCSWGRCAFCNTGGSGLFPSQKLPAEEAFRRVKELVARGERTFCFADDEADGAVLAELARRSLEEGIRFDWTVQTRFHPVMTLEWASLLRRAGCRKLFVGLETFDDRLLRLMGKPVNRRLVDRSPSSPGPASP